MKLFHLKPLIDSKFLVSLYWAWVYFTITFCIPKIGADFATTLNTLARAHKIILINLNLPNNYLQRPDNNSSKNILTKTQLYVYSLLVFIFKNIDFYVKRDGTRSLRFNEYIYEIITPIREYIKKCHLHRRPLGFNQLENGTKGGKM